MNLHIGSGNHPSNLPGWVDLDLGLYEDTPPTVFGSAFHMPFPDDTFDRVYMGHFLEHLRWEDELLDALTEVKRVTRPGGTVMVVGPDIGKAVATNQPSWLLEAIIGGAPADSPGGHQWVATEGLTVLAMVRGGLTNVVPTDVAGVARPDWPNVSQAPWQCAVTATV